MNPPSAVLGGGGVHGEVCWLIAYMYVMSALPNLVSDIRRYLNVSGNDYFSDEVLFSRY